MTKNIWFISDTHFMHANVISFVDEDGDIIRPNPDTGSPFIDIEEHDELMITKWNDVVKPKDRVYHLGDFLIPRRAKYIIPRLNGRICLVAGNHDILKAKEWLESGKITDVKGVVMKPKLGFVMTHIPVHPRQFELGTRWTHNIHGHLHRNLVRLENGSIDYRYINVSVERTGMRPISLEEIQQWIEKDIR